MTTESRYYNVLSSIHKVQICEATPYKGLKQWPTWPPLAEEKTTQQLSHTEIAALKHSALFPCPAFQRRSRREAQAQQTNPHFYSFGGFMVWKKTFGTCCPRNRRSSMSLEVNTGVLAADHRPGAELRVWGRKSLAEQRTMWGGERGNISEQLRRNVSHA